VSEQIYIAEIYKCFFTPFPVVTSKKFPRVRESSELLPELGFFVFLLQFELMFTMVIPKPEKDSGSVEEVSC